jgi:hypothetical protein
VFRYIRGWLGCRVNGLKQTMLETKGEAEREAKDNTKGPSDAVPVAVAATRRQ